MLYMKTYIIWFANDITSIIGPERDGDKTPTLYGSAVLGAART